MSTPILRDLYPRAVALDACEALVEHMAKSAFVLNPHVVHLPRPSDLVDGSDLGLTVQTLTVFAQRGCPAGDWSDPEVAADGLLSVVSALYGGALDHQYATPGILAEGEPETPIETALLGAWARVQMYRGEPVEARHIAVLASMPLRTVRHHIDVGELPACGPRPAKVPAADAVRYLTTRGLTGFTATSDR
jgi:hypothetical protein